MASKIRGRYLLYNLTFVMVLVCALGRTLALRRTHAAIRLSSTTKEQWTKLPRIYLDRDIEVGESISLDTDSMHYLSNVLRLKEGFKFRAFNVENQGGEYLCELASPISAIEAKNNNNAMNPSKRGRKKGSSALSVTILEQLRSAEEERRNNIMTPLPCIVYFAPLKKNKLKLLFEKLTELGVGALQPVLTQNTNQIPLERDDLETYVMR